MRNAFPLGALLGASHIRGGASWPIGETAGHATDLLVIGGMVCLTISVAFWTLWMVCKHQESRTDYPLGTVESRRKGVRRKQPPDSDESSPTNIPVTYLSYEAPLPFQRRFQEMSIHKAPKMATGALPNRPSTDLPHPSNPRYALLMRNLRDDELFRPLPLTRACRKR